MSLDIDELDDLVGLSADQNGNLYFYGNTSSYEGGTYPTDFFIGKMDLQGNVDSSFGTDGIYRSDFPGYSTSSIKKMLVHDDGLFFIGSGINSASIGTQQVFIGKLSLDGSPDINFGNNGYFTDWMLSYYSTAGSIIIDSQDKIVFCGSSTDTVSTYVEYSVIGRLNLSGEPDSSFGSTGILIWDYYAGTLESNFPVQENPTRHGDGAYLDELVEINNNYFLVGRFVGTAYAQLMIMSITKDGQFNPSFASTGPIIYQIDPGANHFVKDLYLQSDQIYLAIDTDGVYEGEKFIIQILDTTGNQMDLHTWNEPGMINRSQSITGWNGEIYVGGFSLNISNEAPGYHSEFFTLYAFDPSINVMEGFATDGIFLGDMGTGDEIGMKSHTHFNNHLIMGGYMNQNLDSNYTDLVFMSVQVEDDLSTDLKASENIEIYPNPTSSYITIQNLEGINDLKITCMDGKPVINETLQSSSVTLDLTNLPKGTYLIFINELPVERLVIQ